jgi:hypothetical protein
VRRWGLAMLLFVLAALAAIGGAALDQAPP